jgi:hypothetical protein
MGDPVDEKSRGGSCGKDGGKSLWIKQQKSYLNRWLLFPALG